MTVAIKVINKIDQVDMVTYIFCEHVFGYDYVWDNSNHVGNVTLSDIL